MFMCLRVVAWLQVTTAIGAKQFYGSATNPRRSEGLEGARAIDEVRSVVCICGRGTRGYSTSLLLLLRGTGGCSPLLLLDDVTAVRPEEREIEKRKKKKKEDREREREREQRKRCVSVNSVNHRADTATCLAGASSCYYHRQ